MALGFIETTSRKTNTLERVKGKGERVKENVGQANFLTLPVYPFPLTRFCFYQWTIFVEYITPYISS
jgi:hypothetical protein